MATAPHEPGEGKTRSAIVRLLKTEGPMAPEIPLDKQRPAEYVFQQNVTQKLSEMRQAEAAEKARKAADAA